MLSARNADVEKLLSASNADVFINLYMLTQHLKDMCPVKYADLFFYKTML